MPIDTTFLREQLIAVACRRDPSDAGAASTWMPYEAATDVSDVEYDAQGRLAGYTMSFGENTADYGFTYGPDGQVTSARVQMSPGSVIDVAVSYSSDNSPILETVYTQ